MVKARKESFIGICSYPVTFKVITREALYQRRGGGESTARPHQVGDYDHTVRTLSFYRRNDDHHVEVFTVSALIIREAGAKLMAMQREQVSAHTLILCINTNDDHCAVVDDVWYIYVHLGDSSLRVDYNLKYILNHLHDVL